VAHSTPRSPPALLRLPLQCRRDADPPYEDQRVAGEFDPLRDEGIAYADCLELQGLRAEKRVMPGMIHGFLNLEAMVPDTCAEVYAAIGSFLNP
jgi:acetyl esterase/lipase